MSKNPRWDLEFALEREAAKSDHNAILNWTDDGVRYDRGFFIGSEDTTGAHIRADDGWPYSIYKRGNQPGVGDAVLCHGIQSRADAEILLELVRRK